MICWDDAREVFGDDGSSGMKSFLNSIREFFRVIPPDQMSTTFVFVYRIRSGDGDESQRGTGRVATAISADVLPGYRKCIEDATVILIVARADGLYDIVAPTTFPSLETLSQQSLVFENKSGVDRFIIGGRSKTMPALAIGAASNFAVATVADLGAGARRVPATRRGGLLSDSSRDMGRRS